MKGPFPDSAWFRALVLASCFSVLAPLARSQTLIWVGGGANGNWSTAGNWNSGVPSTTAGSTQALDFTGTTGLTQTMNNSYSVGTLTFDSAAGAFAIAFGSKVLTIDGSAPEIVQQSANGEALNSGTLAFASNGIIDVTGAGTLSITSKLSGSANITVQGGGILALAGAGTGYSGTTTVAAGTLQVSTSNTVLGTGSAVVDSGATLDITDGRNLSNALTLTGTGSGGGGALESDGSGTATVSGPITLGGDTTVEATAGTLKMTGGVGGTGDLTLDGAGSFTVSGAITTGTGALTIDSSGTTSLSGANTYTGLTTVNAGTVNLSSAINGDLTITGGTVVDKVSGQLASSTNLAINGGEFNMSNKTESISSLSGSSGGTAILALGSGTLTTSQASTTTFDGSITGTGTLAMAGTGTLDLTGSNTAFTGKVNVTDGTVNASAVDAAGSGTVTVSSLGNFQVQGNVSLASKFNISNTGGSSSNGAIENVSGSNTLSGALTVSGASRIQSDSGTLTLSGATGLGANSLNVGGAGNTSITGAITGTSASSITKDGTGTFSVGAANPSFAGTVAVTGGTLQVAVANAFKTSTAITFGAGTTLDLFNTSQSIGTLNGAGTVAFGSSGALTLNSGTDLLSGAFTGAGTLTLATGSTLTLGANFSDANLNIVLAGGTLKLNGTSDTFGNLSITGSSTLDFGSPSASLLTVNGVTLAGSTLLSVTNWANLVDYFYSTTSPGAQGTAPIDQIVFSGFSASATHWSSNPTGPDLETEITPVPEASSYGLIMAGMSLAALAALRWFRES